MTSTTRRHWLGGAAALLAAHVSKAARPRMGKARISALTDEMGHTQTDAVAFAKQLGLHWVELRNVPESGKEFALLSEPELRGFGAELASNNLKVSLLKTSLLKFSWQADEKRFARRKEDLARAIAAAQTFGTGKIRVFTGTRAADPSTAYPAIVKTMEELIPAAENAHLQLLIENDPSQNIGTCAEIKTIMDLLPSKSLGFNWDPQNAFALHETAWPDGFALLPKARMLNVQIQAESLSEAPRRINWKTAMEALQKDGFTGEISVATGTSSGTFEKTDDAIREILHIASELE